MKRGLSWMGGNVTCVTRFGGVGFRGDLGGGGSEIHFHACVPCVQWREAPGDLVFIIRNANIDIRNISKGLMT